MQVAVVEVCVVQVCVQVSVVKLQCKYVCKWILLKCGVGMCASGCSQAAVQVCV